MPTAVELLADDVRRGIVSILGEADRPLQSGAIADRAPFAASVRLVRDRIRELERASVLQQVASASSPTSADWALTTSGKELFRLLALMTRITVRAAGVPASASQDSRDVAVGQTLAALADPLALQILRAVVGTHGITPTALEAACAPIPRRTLYRRLSPLVDGGAVQRIVTGQVPRATTYALDDRWRPVSSILLLSTWWTTRHRPVDATGEPDLEGLLLSVAPLVRVNQLTAGTAVDWILTRPAGSAVSMRVAARDGRVRASQPTASPAAASISGDAREWSAALVTGNSEALVVSGDAAAAAALLAAVRGALLSYMR